MCGGKADETKHSKKIIVSFQAGLRLERPTGSFSRRFAPRPHRLLPFAHKKTPDGVFLWSWRESHRRHSRLSGPARREGPTGSFSRRMRASASPFDSLRSQKKRLTAFFYGAGGNRTRVQRSFHAGVSHRSLCFRIPSPRRPKTDSTVR